MHRRPDNASAVLSQFDTNKDEKLDLEGLLKSRLSYESSLEFSKLDYSFPWDQFPVTSDIPRPIIGNNLPLNTTGRINS
jgi:hypothetical protein